MAYLFIKLPTAALSLFTRHRWLVPTLDIVFSFVPVAILIVVFTKWEILIMTAARAEIALQLLALTLGEAIIRIVLNFNRQL